MRAALESIYRQAEEIQRLRQSLAAATAAPDHALVS
jgi:hypothetical protein